MHSETHFDKETTSEEIFLDIIQITLTFGIKTSQEIIIRDF